MSSIFNIVNLKCIFFKKKNSIFKIFLLFILFYFILISISFSADSKFILFSPNYFGDESNTLKDIHYLNGENLNFLICIPKNLGDLGYFNVSYSCDGSTKTSYLEYSNFEGSSNENCFIVNKRIDFGCDDFSLYVKYKVGNIKKVITRHFVKETQSKLINYVLSKDYTSLSSLDLSYYLYVYNNVYSKDSQKSDDIYDRLKNLRDNDNKCFDKDSCSVVKTSEILRNIYLSGYSTDSRILEDGKIFLENNEISNENNPYNIQIEINNTNNETVSCNLTYDDDSREYDIDENDTESINKDFSDNVNLICSKAIDFNVTIEDFDGNSVFSDSYEDEDNFSYDIPNFACLGDDSCNYDATINALIVYGNSLKNYEELENYVSSHKIVSGDDIYWNGDDEFKEMGLYLMYKDDKDIEDYLKYKQNNDGSFGDGSKYDIIEDTSYSILGLQKYLGENSEYVKDGKNWIYYNEPTFGWGSLEKNSLAYMAIKEKIKPYFEISPFTKIVNTTEIKLSNPTIFKLKDLEVSFKDKNFNKYLVYLENLGDLDPEENMTINFTVSKNFFGKKSTIMYISGYGDKDKKIDLIEIPITVEGKELFSLNNYDDFKISDNNRDVVLKIIPNFNNSNVHLKCTYIDPFTKKGKSFTVNQTETDLILSDDKLENGSFQITFNCKYNNGQIYSKNFKFNVDYVKKSFEVENNSLIINSYDLDAVLKVNSLIDNKQILSFDFEGPLSSYFKPVENEKIVAGGDTRDIYFSVDKDLEKINLSNIEKPTYLIITSSTGYMKKVPVTFNIKNDNEEDHFWLYLIIFIVILVLFILFLVIRKRYQEYLEKEMGVEPVQNEYDDLVFDDFDDLK